MSARLIKSASLLFGQIDLSRASPRRVGTLAAHEGLMLEVEGFPEPLGTTVRIATAGGGAVRGEVVGFRGHRSLILPFDGDAPFAAGARVAPDGRGGMVTCGNALLGRVIVAHGDPLDGRQPIFSRFAWPLAGRKSNPLRRGRVVKSLDVGVRAINGLLSVGEGQRVAIIAGSGVGKSVLMGAYAPGNDALLDEAIAQRGAMVNFARQNARETIDYAASRRALIEGFGA